MRSIADTWRFGAFCVLLCGATAFASGPVGHGAAPGGQGGASFAHASPSPHVASPSQPMAHAQGGHINWHAGWNTGTYPASWNVGNRGIAPRPIRPGGYRSGFGGRPGYGYGRQGRGAAVIVPVFPFYDSGGYGDSGGYYGDAGAPPPPDAAPDYGPPPPADYQSSYGPQDAPPPYPVERAPLTHDEPVVNQPPITVVLQSGQQFVVQNYAVMNGLLWDFSKPAVRKIPLASIDLSASARATSAAGADFPELTSPAP
jgi:hypothetical protein